MATIDLPNVLPNRFSANLSCRNVWIKVNDVRHLKIDSFKRERQFEQFILETDDER